MSSPKWVIIFTDLSASYANLSAWSDHVLPGIQHTSFCLVRNAEARHLTLTVRLFPLPPLVAIPGAEHDRPGIALRSKDPNNYDLLRAVSAKMWIRLCKVERGKRSTLAGRNLEIAVDQWHTLALKARGEVFTAYIDGREPFSHRDRTIRHAGSFGLWSKPNNATYFDDLKAEISN